MNCSLLSTPTDTDASYSAREKPCYNLSMSNGDGATGEGNALKNANINNSILLIKCIISIKFKRAFVRRVGHNSKSTLRYLRRTKLFRQKLQTIRPAFETMTSTYKQTWRGVRVYVLITIRKTSVKIALKPFAEYSAFSKDL